MRTATRTWLAAALLVALAGGSGCGSQARPGRQLAVGQVSSLPVSRSSHVAIVVMENAEYGEVIGNTRMPYVNSLARRYGLATASYSTTHPSLPNYLALTSGSSQGIDSDCTGCSVSHGPNLVDELEASAISWRAYMEGLPTRCFTGPGSGGGYAKRHDPFLYYRDVSGNPERCRHVVGFGALEADLLTGRLPRFIWITPNLCDDEHDCAAPSADRFLARTLPAILHELGPRGFLVLTWDEGTSDRACCGAARGGGHIATILAGPGVRRGARSEEPVDDYGVLGTIEDALGLPRLGGARDPRAGSLSDLLSSSRPLLERRPPSAGRAVPLESATP